MPKPPQSRSRHGPFANSVADLVIDAVGARGDGLARHEGQSVYVPGTLPGEQVRARIESRRGEGLNGEVLELLEESPERVAPPCRHFGACGGCTVQHWRADAVLAWKRQLVATALARRGLGDIAVAAPVAIPAGRRRAAFALVRQGRQVIAGFNARASHVVVDVAECPLLRPELVALLAPLRGALAELAPPRGTVDAVVTLADTGLDVVLAGIAAPALAGRERLALLAEAADLARLSWRQGADGPAEPLARRRPVQVSCAGVTVDLPPGAFVQPSREGEAAIAAVVLAAIGRTQPVADLFAGVGSFSFALAAAGCAVHAVDGAAEAVAALAAAGRRAGLNRVTTEVRDLAARPLVGRELASFGAVVFDPPRAGARAQAEALAAAGPPLVVAVSCDPATFARDARILIDAGYQAGPVTPIDQFPWSAHVECVAAFRR